MTLTTEQKAAGWIEWNGGDCPIKDDRTQHQVIFRRHGASELCEMASAFRWEHHDNPADITAYRIIEAHGADAEPARPTPFPRDYSELVFGADGWSQTIIVDGKRPEWLRDDDRCIGHIEPGYNGWPAHIWGGNKIAIRVRRRKPKRETRRIVLASTEPGADPVPFEYFGTIDLIDGKPDLSTLKIAEDAL